MAMRGIRWLNLITANDVPDPITVRDIQGITGLSGNNVRDFLRRNKVASFPTLGPTDRKCYRLAAVREAIIRAGE